MRRMPKAKTEYVYALSNLSGGLNLWDPDYGLKSSESPEMENLLWRNGMLRSRRGQFYLNEESQAVGYATYERLWHGYVFAHIGDALVCFDAFTGERTDLATGIPEIRGTFFTYDGKLYYKTQGAYKYITATSVGSTWTFTCSQVTPYEPTILINASPYNGSGDLYQPENRMSARKTVWYNAVQGVRTYKLPVTATRVIKVVVDGVELTTGWTYNPLAGTVTFQTAPPVTDPATNNTVRITYELINADAQESLYNCRYVSVYGGTGELCVVMAGNPKQPNAYYWSGNSDIKMDPSYFPIEQVQLAGSVEDRVTGFGKQQNNLIIFKENSVGKTTLGTQTINDRIYIDLPYASINATIGCDLPWSIQLAENNLVFANKTGGVYRILDTTSANENNIVCISRKVNGNDSRPGLLADERAVLEDNVCSCDDGAYYYLCANGHVWCWDYELSTYKDPSWFYLTNIPAIAMTHEATDIYHLDLAGRLTKFREEFYDYGTSIRRFFRSPTLFFGSHDALKNVDSVIVTLGASSLSRVGMQYLTDYMEHPEPTDLMVVDAEEYDAERVPGTRPQSTRTPAVFRRRMHCRRILHFIVTLENNNAAEDFQLISVEIFYKNEGRLR